MAEQANGMVDLGAFKTAETATSGVELELLHPVEREPLTKDGTGPVIMVAGMDSKQYRDTQARQQRERLDRMVRRGRKRGKTVKDEDVDEVQKDALDLIVACTLGWRNVVIDGEELPYSDANARKLYETLPWVREQVEECIGDRSYFFAGARKP